MIVLEVKGTFIIIIGLLAITTGIRAAEIKERFLSNPRINIIFTSCIYLFNLFSRPFMGFWGFGVLGFLGPPRLVSRP